MLEKTKNIHEKYKFEIKIKKICYNVKVNDKFMNGGNKIVENIVIGIEGPVGAGKTSICRELIKKMPNTVLLNGGNLYRAIVYCMMLNKDKMEKIKNIDIKQMMDNLKIQIRIINNESEIFVDGVRIEEEKLQSQETSMNVSVIGGIANNEALFVFARNLIEELKETSNVIVSGRSVMKIYPNANYHFFITADLDERVNRKYIQYKGSISKEQIRKDIIKRDELQEKAGFYELHEITKVIDVTDCKSVKESTNKVYFELEPSYV